VRRETFERYIETVHKLEEEGGRARTKDIAEVLEVKEASVTEMLWKLKRKGLVEYEPYRGAFLTDKGRTIAKRLMRRHRTLAEFLKLIGVDEKTADEDACKIEHVVDSKTVKKLRKFVEFAKGGPGKPKWLEHYRHFLKTGKHPRCERREGSK